MSSSFAYLSQGPGNDGDDGDDRFSHLREFPSSVRPVDDIASVRWIEGRVHPSENARENGVRLWSIIPDGFPGYARLLHPAESKPSNEPMRWAEVAARTGKTVHPLMQWGRLIGSDDYYADRDWAYAPEIGELPEEETQELFKILQGFTTTTDRCYFCIWEGYGSLTEQQRSAPQVSIPDRTFLAYTGPLDAVLEFADIGKILQVPNLWWPADRAWFVATEIDFMHTYVGGSEACIRQILSSPELETFPAFLDDRVDFFSDTINL